MPIGCGGVATVYLAREIGPERSAREVALKLLHVHLRDVTHHGVALFDEARLVGRIEHPHVIQILDVGNDPYGPFLTMNRVEGDTLAELMHARWTTGAPNLAVLLRVLTDALLGLDAAHEQRTESGEHAGLVHRDFTPQNILVGLDGLAQLTDFGIAKAADRMGHTQSGFIKGKVRYMSPEQARGQAIDKKSDVWAAGVIAWEIIAGRRLYPPGDEMATLLKIVTEPVPRIGTIVRDCPPGIDRAIASALERDVEKRCPTAAALRERLLEGFGAPVATWPEVGAAVAAEASARLEELRRRADEVIERRASRTVRIEPIRPAEPTEEFGFSPPTEATRIEVPGATTPKKRSPRARWAVGFVLGALVMIAAVFALERDDGEIRSAEVHEVAARGSADPAPICPPDFDPTPARTEASRGEPAPSPDAPVVRRRAQRKRARSKPVVRRTQPMHDEAPPLAPIPYRTN